MCTLMDGPIFACAGWAAADSSYLTNYFFRRKDLRADCVPTTPTATRQATTSCLEKSVHQMALFHYALASCWGLKAQRDTWPSNLHPSYMSQPGVKLIRPWSDVTGTEGKWRKRNIRPRFPNLFKSSSRFGWLMSALSCCWLYICTEALNKRPLKKCWNLTATCSATFVHCAIFLNETVQPRCHFGWFVVFPPASDSEIPTIWGSFSQAWMDSELTAPDKKRTLAFGSSPQHVPQSLTNHQGFFFANHLDQCLNVSDCWSVGNIIKQ